MLMVSKRKQARPDSLLVVSDSADGDRVNGKSAWHAFEAFVDLVEDLCSVVGQLAFVFRIARKGNHGSMYALLCLGKPLVTLLRPATLWSTRASHHPTMHSQR